MGARSAPRASGPLSLDEARRIALAAQGLDRPRPRRVEARHVRQVVERIGLLQLDYVNVLVPAHYLVVFSRLGPYPRALLDRVAYGDRAFTEQWAHEACLVPVGTWPLLRHRMESHRVRPWGIERFLEANPAYVALVLEELRARGPLTAEDLPGPEGASRRLLPGTWIGTVPRVVLEAHFGRGLLAITERRRNFARVYDLAERVIPRPHYVRVVAAQAAQRALLLLAARAMGVATAADLADYYRMSPREARPRLEELVGEGALEVVSVDGWREPAFLHPEAARPRRVAASRLLSPFDPLVWFRPRAARLFGFHYRLEIYTPAAKRRWGYYVLPFLHGDRLAARVDLKADRPGRRLLVLAAHAERHGRAVETAQALAAELTTLAGWLGLEAIDVASRGDLARLLRAAVRA
jgi:uncharacterized protein